MKKNVRRRLAYITAGPLDIAVYRTIDTIAWDKSKSSEDEPALDSKQALTPIQKRSVYSLKTKTRRRRRNYLELSGYLEADESPSSITIRSTPYLLTPRNNLAPGKNRSRTNNWERLIRHQLEGKLLAKELEAERNGYACRTGKQ